MEKTEIKVTLTLKTDKDDGNVYFKRDGQRFDSDHTLKLIVETAYVFILKFQPSIHINTCSIMGTSVTATETSRKTESCSYTIPWTSTGISATKKGQRDTVMITIEIGGYGTLTLKLQVKFYKIGGSQHCTWGTALHHIDYNCLHKDDASFIEIEKEIYR